MCCQSKRMTEQRKNCWSSFLSFCQAHMDDFSSQVHPLKQVCWRPHWNVYLCCKRSLAFANLHHSYVQRLIIFIYTSVRREWAEQIHGATLDHPHSSPLHKMNLQDAVHEQVVSDDRKEGTHYNHKMIVLRCRVNNREQHITRHPECEETDILKCKKRTWLWRSLNNPLHARVSVFGSVISCNFHVVAATFLSIVVIMNHANIYSLKLWVVRRT